MVRVDGELNIEYKSKLPKPTCVHRTSTPNFSEQNPLTGNRTKRKRKPVGRYGLGSVGRALSREGVTEVGPCTDLSRPRRLYGDLSRSTRNRARVT